MLGAIVTSADGAPVARVLAVAEAVLRVGPASDLARVLAFVDALFDGYTARLRRVCDNRDDFALRPAASPSEFVGLEQLRAALAFACGVEPDPSAARWATTTYVDVADPAVAPDVIASCALGRRFPRTSEAGVALYLGVADSTAWADLHHRVGGLAQRWPDLWRWITVGYRFCPLEYNGFHLAHLNIRRVAPRMPAADVGDTLGVHTSFWTTRLRTVGWATFVAPDLAARCGPELRSRAMGIEVTTLPGGGVCVRIPGGPEPGTAQRYVPPGFAAADRLLLLARALDDVVFLPPWDADTTREWLERWQTLPPSPV